MTLFSVAASSAAALSFEVLLTRLFAVTQWNHLSFMVISIAMLGYAAGGIAVSAGAGKGGALFAVSLALLPAGLLFGF